MIKDRLLKACFLNSKNYPLTKLMKSENIERDLKNYFTSLVFQESKSSLWKRLNRIGFDIKPEEIFSSLTAAHDLIVSRQLRPMLLLSESALEVTLTQILTHLVGART